MGNSDVLRIVAKGNLRCGSEKLLLHLDQDSDLYGE